jgi:uncharacterized protein
MPEYLTPGVYMEEFEMGARPIEGVSTSTVGFVGATERGPTISPLLITSWTQFMRIYGGYTKDSYLPYAVEGFFSNGGKRCFISRVVRHDIFNEEGTLVKGGAKSAYLIKNNVTYTAVGEGIWGNRVAIRVENSSMDPKNEEPNIGKRSFKLIIAYWKTALIQEDFEVPGSEKDRKLRELLERAAYIETFDNLSEDETSPDYFLKKLGDPLNNLSNLVILSGSGRPNNTEKNTDNKFVFFELLTCGLDAQKIDESGKPVIDPKTGQPENEEREFELRDFQGDPAAPPGEKDGLVALGDIDEISILCSPDLHKLPSPADQTFMGDLLTQCENLKDRFAILDVGMGKSNISDLTIANIVKRQSKYGAIYYPWLNIYDPLSRQNKLIPPGGHIAGIYARSDTERGVHKAPANEVVRGALGVEFKISKEEQGILNPRGINVIRNFTDRGTLVWGARNIVLDPLWKYVNVRRLFIYVEESIEKGTQWVVFEPNNERLWARVKATITQFLTTVWRDGALMGTKPEEAFFVKCDRTTMTQDDIDNGRLICIIGIAPVKPAEFVIFRIAQWAGGSAATE